MQYKSFLTPIQIEDIFVVGQKRHNNGESSSSNSNNQKIIVIVKANDSTKK